MNRNRKIFTAVAATALAATITVGGVATIGNAATEHFQDAAGYSASWEKYKKDWDEISSDYEKVALSVGKNASELNFGWYSKTKETPSVKIGVLKNLAGKTKDDDFSNAETFTGTQEEITDIPELKGYYSNKVTVKGLKPDTTYHYSVFQDGKWQNSVRYSTESTKEFRFMYVGDPQIGASNGQTSADGSKLDQKKENGTLAARNDSYNWNQVLNHATQKFNDLAFVLSAGDQVNTSSNEEEFAGFLYPSALRSLPMATTIGNHDAPTGNYSYHFNYPNKQTTDATTEGKTAAGTDYYYRYGDVLFIILDTNNYNCATHENVIKKAVNANKDAKWRIVAFHQDIYGSGLDHSASDGIILRTQLTPLMDKYKIDMVLQGHDHTYSRTYQLTSDNKKHSAYDQDTAKYDDDESQTAFLNQNQCYSIKSGVKSGTVKNPKGTVYMEANSSTGSKFYNLIPTQQDYISERSQTWVPSYSVVTVKKDSISIQTYEGMTGNTLGGSSKYTIKKTSKKK